jgi:hypothetical protein
MLCPHCRPTALANGGDLYYCLKQRADLFAGLPNGAHLSQEERWFIGMDIPTPAGQDGWKPLSLAAAEAYSTEEAARLRGIRWVIDVGGNRYETMT